MALVYTKRDAWSDIEKESTGQTEAIGASIEAYYSSRYLPWTQHEGQGEQLVWDNHLLN